MLSEQEETKIDLNLKNLNWSITPNELKNNFNKLVSESENYLVKILSIYKKDRSFSNTIVAFENLISDLNSFKLFTSFLAAVSNDSQVRSESRDSEEKINNYLNDIIYREDVYFAIQEYIQDIFYGEKEKLGKSDQRLADKVFLDFKRAGRGLIKEKRTRLKEINEELNSLKKKFFQAINEDQSTIHFSKKDLEGISKIDLCEFSKNENQNFIIPVNFMNYVTMSRCGQKFGAHLKIIMQYQNKSIPENIERLNRALVLRDEFAQILGYSNYVNYVLEISMAKKQEKIEIFLRSNFQNNAFFRNFVDS